MVVDKINELAKDVNEIREELVMAVDQVQQLDKEVKKINQQVMEVDAIKRLLIKEIENDLKAIRDLHLHERGNTMDTKSTILSELRFYEPHITTLFDVYTQINKDKQ